MLVILTTISIFGDSWGFIWSDRAWTRNTVNWRAVGYSFLSYVVGVVAWIFIIKYIKQVGNVAIEIQTAGWFLLTMIGVSVVAGDFMRWSMLDKMLAIITLVIFTILIRHVLE